MEGVYSLLGIIVLTALAVSSIYIASYNANFYTPKPGAMFTVSSISGNPEHLVLCLKNNGPVAVKMNNILLIYGQRFWTGTIQGDRYVPVGNTVCARFSDLQVPGGILMQMMVGVETSRGSGLLPLGRYVGLLIIKVKYPDWYGLVGNTEMKNAINNLVLTVNGPSGYVNEPLSNILSGEYRSPSGGLGGAFLNAKSYSDGIIVTMLVSPGNYTVRLYGQILEPVVQGELPSTGQLDRQIALSTVPRLVDIYQKAVVAPGTGQTVQLIVPGELTVNGKKVPPRRAPGYSVAYEFDFQDMVEHSVVSDKNNYYYGGGYASYGQGWTGLYKLGLYYADQLVKEGVLHLYTEEGSYYPTGTGTLPPDEYIQNNIMNNLVQNPPGTGAIVFFRDTTDAWAEIPVNLEAGNYLLILTYTADNSGSGNYTDIVRLITPDGYGYRLHSYEDSGQYYNYHMLIVPFTADKYGEYKIRIELGSPEKDEYMLIIHRLILYNMPTYKTMKTVALQGLGYVYIQSTTGELGQQTLKYTPYLTYALYQGGHSNVVETVKLASTKHVGGSASVSYGSYGNYPSSHTFYGKTYKHYYYVNNNPLSEAIVRDEKIPAPTVTVEYYYANHTHDNYGQYDYKYYLDSVDFEAGGQYGVVGLHVSFEINHFFNKGDESPAYGVFRISLPFPDDWNMYHVIVVYGVQYDTDTAVSPPSLSPNNGILYETSSLSNTFSKGMVYVQDCGTQIGNGTFNLWFNTGQRTGGTVDFAIYKVIVLNESMIQTIIHNSTSVARPDNSIPLVAVAEGVAKPVEDPVEYALIAGPYQESGTISKSTASVLGAYFPLSAWYAKNPETLRYETDLLGFQAVEISGAG